MGRRRRIGNVAGIVALFLLPLLAACAGIGAGASSKVNDVKTLGIISALGARFEVRRVGLTVFNNDLKELPIDSWGIDELVVGRTRGLLARSFDVRPVTYNKAPFTEQASIWNPVSVGDKVRAEASPQGLDAYLVVVPGLSAYSNTNQNMRGLGIVHGGITDSLLSHYFVHALYEVTLVDGHQFGSMGSAIAFIPNEQRSLFAGNFVAGPHREVDETWWPTSLDAASNQRLKGAVVELIDQSLPGALSKVHLVN
jgi:hypothetical protein